MQTGTITLFVYYAYFCSIHLRSCFMISLVCARIKVQWVFPPTGKGLNYQYLGQLCQCNSVRVHPYAYPQHMMLLKHFPYLQYGCGKQSVVVYSLNKIIMPSFHCTHAGLNYQNLGQLCQSNSIRVHPYLYPQHMTLLKNVQYIQYGCGKRSVVVVSLNNAIMQSFHSSHAGLNYQNLGQLCLCSSIRVNPYAYPQHRWCSNSIFIFNMDVGSSQWWYTASTMSSYHHFKAATQAHITKIRANSASVIV